MNHPHPWLAAYPKDIPWEQSFAPKPVYALLQDAADMFPQQHGVEFLGAAYDYYTLNRMAAYFAAALKEAGVEKGDRVGLLLPNCPQFIIAYFGILRAGGVVVSINPLYTAPEIEHIIRDSGLRTLVTLNLKPLLEKALALQEATDLSHLAVSDFSYWLPPIKRHAFRWFKRKDIALMPSGDGYNSFESMISTAEHCPPVWISPEEDIAVLQYTGGTTGVPKGAALTHAGVSINAAQAAAWFPMVEPGKETVMGILPFFHVFAMTAVMLFSCIKGARMVMHPRFELQQVLKSITRHQPTLMPAVPTIFAAINHYPKLKKYDISSIQLCISGGAPLPGEVQRQFETLTGCTIVEGYGLTEASPVVAVNPVEADPPRVGSIGLPLPGTEVQICALESGLPVTSPEAVGELRVRGPQLMQGYWQNPDATAETIRNGWLLTGDLARMDEDGYLYIVDRLKEMIISGGYNVYPRNIEEALYAHPAVAEAAVIGVGDALKGQVPQAFVVCKPGQEGITADTLRDYLREHIAPYAVPKTIIFRDELPKTLIGKIDKKALG